MKQHSLKANRPFQLFELLPAARTVRVISDLHVSEMPLPGVLGRGAVV